MKVIIGAGGVVQEGWISTEQAQLNLLIEQSFALYFGERRATAFLAEHVWEHLTIFEGFKAAENCLKYLAPGGTLRIAVPDRLHRDPDYIRWTEPGGIGPGATDHKTFYDLEVLCSLMSTAGFSRVMPIEWWGSDRRFHALPWSPDQGFVRRSLKHDHRNATRAIPYTSLIVDAVKGA